MRIWETWFDSVAGGLAVLQAGPAGDLALLLFVIWLFLWICRRFLPNWGRGWR